MKQKYETAELELLKLYPHDILTDSPDDGLVDDSDEDFRGGDIIIIA